jgi:two-component system chemotaxis response regulator CheB
MEVCMSHVARRDVVVIGASAGGVDALLSLAAELPADLPATIFVVQHMAAGFGSRMPELLSARGPLRASHPLDGEVPSRGRIYIAPPDMHLTLRGEHMSVARGPKENSHRPSVDVLFRSAAQAYGARVIGVVLTGHLDCGTAGLFSIKARGGIAIAQDPSDARVPAMPESAIASAQVDHVVTLAALPSLLERLTREPVVQPPTQLRSETLELEGELLGAPAPLVCPLCQGVLTESDEQDFALFRCHVGHTFSLRSMVLEQAESLERALWSAVRALEEAAALTRRLAQGSRGDLRTRFEEKELDQRQQAAVIRDLLLRQGRLSVDDVSRVKATEPQHAQSADKESEPSEIQR